MPTNTPRLGLVQPIGADAPSLIRTGDTTNTNILDAAALYKSGTLAARPAAGTQPAGTVYYATDSAQFFDNDGTKWNLRVMSSPGRAYRSAGGPVGGPGNSPIFVDTVTIGPASAFSGGLYQCPKTGVYLVSSQTAMVAPAGDVVTSTVILKNGVVVSQGSACVSTTVSDPIYSNCMDILSCATGDTLQPAIYNSTGSGGSLRFGPSLNYLAVQPLT